MASPPRILILACGALANELLHLVKVNGWRNVTVEFLPAELHNRPKDIPHAVMNRLENRRGRYDRTLLGYADCGTGGHLDLLCAAENIERLPGAHCYEFFAGHDLFAAMHDEEPGTFYLTDYLTKHFDRLIMDMLGIEAHPELRDMYFGNYRRVVYLAQTENPELVAQAKLAASKLDLEFELRSTGYGELESNVVTFVKKNETAS